MQTCQLPFANLRRSVDGSRIRGFDVAVTDEGDATFLLTEQVVEAVLFRVADDGDHIHRRVGRDGLEVGEWGEIAGSGVGDCAEESDRTRHGRGDH